MNTLNSDRRCETTVVFPSPQFRHTPGDPIRRRKVLRTLKDASIGRLIQQELVKVRRDIRHLIIRKHAVRVIAVLREAHVLRHTESLPDFVRSDHAAIATPRTQPDIRRILDGQQRSGSHHARQHVMVKWQGVGAVHKRVKALGEPDILGHDLGGGLHHVAHGLFGEGEPPTSVAALAGFLRDGQGDTGIVGAGHKGAFAVAGAACYGKAGCVDLGGWCHLESVDEAADSPRPRDQGSGTGIGAVQIEVLPNTAASGVILERNIVLVESQDCDTGRYRDAEATVGDNGREGAVPES